jgi:adenylate cyclase
MDRFKHRFLAVRPLRWLIPLLLVVGLAVLQVVQPAWADRPEGWTIDARFLLRGMEAPRNPVVILALDEASFQSLGNLRGENIHDWPRSSWAELVDRLAACGPRLIVLDIVFDTPAADPAQDAALAEAIERAGNVILAAHFEQSDTFLTYSPPLKSLASAAAGVGVANMLPDPDGVIRTAPLLYRWGEDTVPSASLATAMLARGAPLDVNVSTLGGRLALPVRFRGPEGTFPTYALIDFLEGEIPADAFQDAIVLVGFTTHLEQDRHPAPFAPQTMPGVEIQAAAVDSLLAGDWYHFPPAWLPPLLVAALGLLALAAVNLPRPGLGLALYTLLLLAYIILAVAFFLGGRLVPLAAPLAAALVAGGAAISERTIFAEQDKRRMRQRFAGVMSPERLSAVMDHWDELRQAERPRKQAAVLFSDIRGFTNATELLMQADRSTEMVRFLNAYLEAMSTAVFKEHGVVYDVVGDGLMILFGLPDPMPDYAERAVRAAVRMAQAAEDLQPLWPLRDVRPLQIGIGVNCGSVVDALVGGGRRLNYQVIGDPVNTAARVESHCKLVMELPRPPGGNVPVNATILLTAALHEKVSASVLVDEHIPPFEARGKAQPLRVVRLLGWKGELT